MGFWTGDEVRLADQPSARRRAVKILGHDLIRIDWLIHPTHARRIVPAMDTRSPFGSPFGRERASCCLSPDAQAPGYINAGLFITS